MLVKTLHEQLRVRVQSPCGLLGFEGGVSSIKSAENSPFAFGVAPKAILAWLRFVIVIAMRAVGTHSHAKQVLVSQKYHDPEAFDAG